MRLVSVLLLGALCVFAFQFRERLEPSHRTDVELPGGTTWLIDDPDGCYHLRRVELALELGSVPLSDTYLNFPQGSAVPWPSFFDGLLAAGTRAILGEAVTSKGERFTSVREGRVENLLAHAPPLFGALTVIGVFLAALAFSRSDSRGWAYGSALTAAALYAVAPNAVWYAGVARIDHHVATALFLSLMLACAGRALRSEEGIESFVLSLLAGVLAAFSLLTWLASAVTVGIVGAFYFARAIAVKPEHAALAQRGGIAFFAAAATLISLPASVSPWNESQPGSLINLSNGVPRALLAATVPFIVLLVCQRRGLSRWIGTGVSLIATAAAVLLLPGFVDGALEGFAWASRQNQFMDVVAESRPLTAGDASWLAIGRDLGLAAFLAPLVLPCLFLRARGHERWLLVVTIVLLVAMTFTQRRFANSLAVPLTIGLGVVAGELWPARGRATHALRGGLCAAFLVLAALTVVLNARASTADAADMADMADWRFERISGLRWMRANTPSPGAYNAPGVVASYGVLSTWGYGHAIEYHARRPSIATNFGSFVGADNFRDAPKALLETDAAAFDAALARLGADYVVTTARMLGELPSMTRTAELSQPERASFFTRGPNGKTYSQRTLDSAVYQLSLHSKAVGEFGFGELELVWRSERFETQTGAKVAAGTPGAGPVLSIWKRTRGASDPAIESAPR